MILPSFIAVDWGTTRLRASLVGADGSVVATVGSDAGVQSVAAGGFPAALDAACRPWFDADPDLPVLMAGMVGSRNGWAEAPYAPCPAGAEEIAARLLALPGAGRRVSIVPGVDCRWADGAYDVMRGEETQALGTGVRDGLLALPGTHGKWIEMRDGRIARFATFVTGELFAAVSSSFVGRLAAEPHDDPAGAALAAGASKVPGGLTRALFQARARALAGDLPPAGVRPFLSRLMVEAEIAGALDLFGRPDAVHLVSGEPQRSIYRAALAERGLAVHDHDTPTVTLAGLKAIMRAAALGL
ncbi:2-dehydro-3-deoxygalactonokinase [Lichenibacterium minor]|uniref:2-dehydro-3-deoxygalactonokinase n=1 Tax=Lichenibacterium minor TaxID=2316528 RepID=A0A4Q2UBJ6_9HYPH|nr:2-dehydro-3-deoxygalactonokinase [Lichenibacterium minor]RYC32547.1 2-dehydro-3-deoxygalactonokinase [Lichenibacterium minor]